MNHPGMGMDMAVLSCELNESLSLATSDSVNFSQPQNVTVRICTIMFMYIRIHILRDELGEIKSSKVLLFLSEDSNFIYSRGRNNTLVSSILQNANRK